MKTTKRVKLVTPTQLKLYYHLTVPGIKPHKGWCGNQNVLAEVNDGRECDCNRNEEDIQEQQTS